MTQQEDIERGQRAKRLLEDPLMIEAFQKIETDLSEARDHSKWNERDLREHVHMQLYMLKALQGYLDSVVRNGDFTMKKVNAERTRAKK